MGLIGNPDKYSQTATNKYLMRQCFMENGAPPKYCLTDGEVPMAISTFRFPVIVKPTDRSAVVAWRRWRKQEDLQRPSPALKKESFQQKAD